MKKQNKQKKKRTKKQRALIFLCVTVSLAVLISAGYFIFEKVKYPPIKAKETVRLASLASKTDDIVLIAHRGLSSVAPENTLPAFEKAGEAKFYGAECDVHITSDGEWVIMHDSDVRRMCGVHKLISKSSLSELEKLNIVNGANIDEYYTVKIPTLESYLNLCFEYSLVPVIEVKCSNCSFDNMKSLYRLVSSSEAGKNAVFISFYKSALENLRAIDENTQCLLLVNEMIKEDVDYCVSNSFGIDFNANNKNLTDETVRYAVSSSIQTACWTVDTRETLDRMLSLGVRIFTTNRILPEV